jgi:hypothetical protein
MELAYVQANVSAALSGPVKISVNALQWTAPQAFDVVLVFSGDVYFLYTCVTQGMVLTTHTGSVIIHVSGFLA